MRKLCAAIAVLLVAVTCAWADTQDTTVFKAVMSPDNEVPPVIAPGTSGLSTVTVRVTRDLTGNITAASVIFEIDFTVPGATTFTGLHIHNITAGNTGGVVINTGLSGVNATGTGRITRVVNYTSTDTDGLRYVTGLLDAPENYYVNIHSTVQPGGLMRAPLLKTSLTFRPPMSPAQEAPPVTGVDAEGAALITVQVNRNDAGVITSGVVTFDVDYRLPANSVISGLHIHNGAAGVSGPVVIGTDIGGPSRVIMSPSGRGNVFRVVDIDNANANGLTALNGLFTDPTQYYVNIHTTTNASGVMRGQLSKDTYAFFGLMTQAEEVPNSGTPATANTMTIATVTRDGTGNITGGTVSFNVAYSGFGGTVTFTGLHIHNQIFGVNGGVVIDTGIGGVAQGNSVTDDDGDGSINRDVTIDSSTRGGASLTALKGLLANPENYYVNIHTTVFTGGIIRAQLAREVYHYVTAMSPAKEVPVVNSTASATGVVTVKIARDPATGAINGGQVTFDVNTVGSGPTTFTGLHIHSGSAAVASGPVVINTGLSGTNNVDTQDGTTNITRVVNIGPTDTPQLAMLGTLITNPDQAYINIHTSVNPGGLARSQMLSVVNYVPQAAGGGDWITSITITNPLTNTYVHGIIDTFQSNGTAMPAALVDPNISFLIPPGGSTTVNLHNKGNLATGYARVYSSGDVTLKAGYNYPTFPNTATVEAVTARSVSIPVTTAPGTFGTGVAFLNVTGGTVFLSLRNASSLPVASSSFDVTAGQHVTGFIDNFFTGLPSPFSGRLVIENRPPTGDGVVSAMSLQFNTTLLPVLISPLP